jgi:hypothetical protein
LPDDFELPDGFQYCLIQFDKDDNISDILTRTLIRVKQVRDDGSLSVQIVGYPHAELLRVTPKQLGLDSVSPDTTLVGYVPFQRKPDEIFFCQVEHLPDPDDTVLNLFAEE